MKVESDDLYKQQPIDTNHNTLPDLGIELTNSPAGGYYSGMVRSFDNLKTFEEAVQSRDNLFPCDKKITLNGYIEFHLNTEA